MSANGNEASPNEMGWIARDLETRQARKMKISQIKRPVILVSAWLEKQDEESLRWMIHPIEKEELADQPTNEDQERAEQERLTLEEFLELL
jgi:hypothetical protein